MTPHCIQQVIQHADADATAPLAHGRHHPPLVGLWVVTFYTGNGVAAAPATN